MNLKAFITLAFLIVAVSTQAQKSLEKFDRSAFYEVIASEDIDLVNAELSLLKGVQIPEKEAYEGTLLMKKAGLAQGMKEKLNLFKAGHKKLEKAINSNKDNTEYRFLRLIIQENSPKILGYKDQIDEDSEHIGKNFKNLSPVVQKAIIGYSKKSKVIKVADN